MFGSDLMRFTYVRSPDEDGGTVRLSKQVLSRLSSSTSPLPSSSVSLVVPTTLLRFQSDLKFLLNGTFPQPQVISIREQRLHGSCTQGLIPFREQSLHRELST